MNINNIKLRNWSMQDIDSLVKFANNFNISKNLTNKFPHPYSQQDGENFINFANANHPSFVFAIDINGLAIGGIGLHPQQDIFCKNAELGYWIAEEYWNKGIVSLAIHKIINLGFKDLDINRIFARPFKSNLASQKVLEKNGFILEACLEKTIFKNGVYEDELIYSVRKTNYE